MIAQATGQSIADVAEQTQVSNVVTGDSLKAVLDLNWDDPQERSYALSVILNALDTIESSVEKKTDDQQLEPVKETLEVARKIQTQDVTINSQGQPILKTGVASYRRISIEDADMRHGRKSRSQRFNGYKRHVLRDLDIGVVRAVGLTLANAPEAEVTSELDVDLKAQKVNIIELHIDRAYLSSSWVKQRSLDLEIFCKAWPVRNGSLFNKTDFVLNWEQGLIRCPNQVSIPFKEGKTVHFPTSACNVCPLQLRCTTSTKGRSVSIHPDEIFMQELRKRQSTETGRAKLRERTQVEHTLAHIGRWQGDRARYVGWRKNLFDLRFRCSCSQSTCNCTDAKYNFLPTSLLNSLINDRVFLFLFFVSTHHLFFVNPYYLTDALDKCEKGNRQQINWLMRNICSNN